MTPTVPDYEEAFAAAIHDFWMIKTDQQAAADLVGRNLGTSGAVRAGKHMLPFEALIRRVVEDAGIEPDPAPSDTMYLPGFYRETKSWDVVLQYKGHALAIVEAKSQGSSLANNFNNRVESRRPSVRRLTYGSPTSVDFSCQGFGRGSAT